MLPNIKTYENGWSNSSENMGVVAIKNFETQFASPNLSIYFNLMLGVGVRCDIDIFKLTASAQFIYREVYGVN